MLEMDNDAYTRVLACLREHGKNACRTKWQGLFTSEESLSQKIPKAASSVRDILSMTDLTDLRQVARFSDLSFDEVKEEREQ